MTLPTLSPHHDLELISDAKGLAALAKDGPDAVYLVSFIYNEMLRLPYFLEHYRKLGVTRFFFVSNNSGDGSAAFLCGQTDCVVFHTAAAYSSARQGIDWANAIGKTYFGGKWGILADADELLVYPHCEHAPLPVFCRWLDEQGAEGVYTLMVDMYGDKPLTKASYDGKGSFFDATPWLDRDYVRVSRLGVPGLLPTFPSHEYIGGPRHRLFYNVRVASSLWFRLLCKLYNGVLHKLKRKGLLKTARLITTPPTAYKVPLIKWNEGVEFKNSHQSVPLRLAKVSGALLHFKYFQDFSGKVTEAIRRKSHFNGSAEYKRYAEYMHSNPDMTFMYEGSLKFENSDTLLEAGLMTGSRTWRAKAG